MEKLWSSFDNATIKDHQKVIVDYLDSKVVDDQPARKRSLFLSKYFTINDLKDLHIEKLSTDDNSLLMHDKITDRIFSVLKNSEDNIENLSALASYVLESIPISKNEADNIFYLTQMLTKIRNQPSRIASSPVRLSNKVSSSSSMSPPPQNSGEVQKRKKKQIVRLQSSSIVTDYSNMLMQDNERNNYFVKFIILAQLKDERRIKDMPYDILRTLLASTCKILNIDRHFDNLADLVFNRQEQFRTTKAIKSYITDLDEEVINFIAQRGKRYNGRDESYFSMIRPKLHTIRKLSTMHIRNLKEAKLFISQLRNFLDSEFDLSRIEDLIESQDKRLALRTKALAYINSFLEKSDEEADLIFRKHLIIPEEMQNLNIKGHADTWNEFITQYNRFAQILIKKATEGNYSYLSQVLKLQMNPELMIQYAKKYDFIIYLLIKPAFISNDKESLIYDEKFQNAALNDNQFLIPWVYYTSSLPKLEFDTIFNAGLPIEKALFVTFAKCFTTYISDPKIAIDYFLKRYSKNSNRVTMIMRRLQNTESKFRNHVLDFVKESILLLPNTFEGKISNEMENRVKLALNILGGDHALKISEKNINNLCYPTFPHTYELSEEEVSAIFKYFSVWTEIQEHFATRYFFAAMLFLLQNDTNLQKFQHQIEIDNKIADFSSMIDSIANFEYDSDKCEISLNNPNISDIDVATHACRFIALLLSPSDETIIRMADELPKVYGNDLLASKVNRDPTSIVNYIAIFFDRITIDLLKREELNERQRFHLFLLYATFNFGDLRSIDEKTFLKCIDNDYENVLKIIRKIRDYRFKFSKSVVSSIMSAKLSNQKLLDFVNISRILDSSFEEFQELCNSFYPKKKDGLQDVIDLAFKSPENFPCILFFNSFSMALGSFEDVDAQNGMKYVNFKILSGSEIAVEGIAVSKGKLCTGTITFNPDVPCKIRVFSPSDDIISRYNARSEAIDVILQCNEAWLPNLDLDIFQSKVHGNLPPEITPLALLTRENIIKQLLVNNNYNSRVSRFFPNFGQITRQLIDSNRLKGNDRNRHGFHRFDDEPPMNREMEYSFNRAHASEFFKGNSDFDPLIIQLLKQIKTRNFTLENLMNRRFPFIVNIQGEGGIDGGGPGRQIFYEICNELCENRLGIFTDLDGKINGLIPIKDSEHLHFAGFWLGLCIAHKMPYDFNFNSLVYNYLAGKRITRDDIINFLDAELNKYKYKVTQISQELIDHGVFPSTFDIISSNGKIVNISQKPVTPENFRMYIETLAQYRLDEFNQAMKVVKEGFNMVIPDSSYSQYPNVLHDALESKSLLTADEIIKRLKFVDVEPSQRSMLLSVIRKFKTEELYLFLEYVTARKKLSPYDDLKIKVMGQRNTDIDMKTAPLPIASTCTNELILYKYGSIEIMLQKFTQCFESIKGGNTFLIDNDSRANYALIEKMAFGKQ